MSFTRNIIKKVCIVQKRDSGRLFAMKYVSRGVLDGRGALGGVIKEVELLSSLEHPFLVNLWFSFQGKCPTVLLSVCVWVCISIFICKRVFLLSYLFSSWNFTFIYDKTLKRYGYVWERKKKIMNKSVEIRHNPIYVIQFDQVLR